MEMILTFSPGLIVVDICTTLSLCLARWLCLISPPRIDGVSEMMSVWKRRARAKISAASSKLYPCFSMFFLFLFLSNSILVVPIINRKSYFSIERFL